MTLKEFKNKYLGKQVEFHSYGAGAYNQCVDLVNQYINDVLDTNTKDYTEIIGTNAKDFKTRYDKEDFYWIPNTPNGVPEQGDIIVWNGRAGGGAGHVAIFLEGDVNTFRSLDQNWSQVERVTLETHNYTNVSGWLRPIKPPVQDDDCEGRIKIMRGNMERFIDERDRARAEKDEAKEDVENKEEEIGKINRKMKRELKAKDTLYMDILSKRDVEIADLKSEIIKLKSQGGVIPMNKELIWESLKAPLRQGLLALYAFAINQLLVFITNLIGFEFTLEQRAQIIGYGTPLVWAIISAIDRFVHKVGKDKGDNRLIKGLSRF